MGKGKDKKKSSSKGKGAESRSSEKRNGKGKGKGQDHAVATEIATAEKRLAKALSAVDSAREVLIVREQELRKVLQKHGRLPQLDALESKKPEEDDADDDGDDAVASVSAGPETQLEESDLADDENSDVGELSEGADAERHIAASDPTASNDINQGARDESVPLFDQHQVVATAPEREEGAPDG